MSGVGRAFRVLVAIGATAGIAGCGAQPDVTVTAPSMPMPAAAQEPAAVAPTRSAIADAPRMSCEQARSIYLEGYDLRGTPPELTANAYGAVVNKGSYLNRCGVPTSTAVDICVAVQGGRAVGVTVVTRPRDQAINVCIADQIRGLVFPSSPRLDVTRTSFAN